VPELTPKEIALLRAGAGQQSQKTERHGRPPAGVIDSLELVFEAGRSPFFLPTSNTAL
jgi:hypothetical protein